VDAGVGSDVLFLIQLGLGLWQLAEDLADGRQGLATKFEVNESEAGLIAP
jgi:hypothetical protein